MYSAEHKKLKINRKKLKNTNKNYYNKAKQIIRNTDYKNKEKILGTSQIQKPVEWNEVKKN